MFQEFSKKKSLIFFKIILIPIPLFNSIFDILLISKNYFISYDSHHDIYRFSYWQIFWYSS